MITLRDVRGAVRVDGKLVPIVNDTPPQPAPEPNS